MTRIPQTIRQAIPSKCASSLSGNKRKNHLSPAFVRGFFAITCQRLAAEAPKLTLCLGADLQKRQQPGQSCQTRFASAGGSGACFGCKVFVGGVVLARCVRIGQTQPHKIFSGCEFFCVRNSCASASVVFPALVWHLASLDCVTVAEAQSLLRLAQSA